MRYGGLLIPVGDRLRELRLARGLSEAELGRRLAVRGPTISRYETGESQIRANDLPRLAEALNVSPCDFFEGQRPTAGQRLSARVLARLENVPEHDLDLLFEFMEWRRFREHPEA